MWQRPWINEMEFWEAREDRSGQSTVVSHRYSCNGFSVFLLICLLPLMVFLKDYVNQFFYITCVFSVLLKSSKIILRLKSLWKTLCNTARIYWICRMQWKIAFFIWLHWSTRKLMKMLWNWQKIKGCVLPVSFVHNLTYMCATPECDSINAI